MSIYNVKHFTKIEQIPENIFFFLNENPFSNYETLQSLEELKANPGKYEGLLECLIVEKNGIIQVLTFRVPPYNLMISHACELTAVKAIVEYIGKERIQVPGIFGPSEACSLFVEEWENMYGEGFQTSNESWFFLLEKLNQLPKNIGNVLTASGEHKKVLFRWSEASILELIPKSPETFYESCRKNLAMRIRDKKIFILMVNETLVSMGSITGKYRDMQFINDIYTPPEHRRKGYATELCTQLVRKIKKDNNNRPVLTVFVSNEKAMRIYTKIGFKRNTKVALYLKQN